VDAALSNTPSATLAARIAAAGGLVLIFVVSAIIWFFDPTKSNFFPVCPLYTMTGLACPGCGLTRGFHALFHGDLVTALDFNALIPFFVLAFLLLVLSLISVVVRGKGLVRISSSPPFLIGTLVLLLVFGVLRNLPVYPFTVLYP
jgi:hypothetical protein